jgi:glutamate-ammonia-ligase adenylyltransferase
LDPSAIDRVAAEAALQSASMANIALNDAQSRDLIARTGAAAQSILTALLQRPELVAQLSAELRSGQIAAATVLPFEESAALQPLQSFLRRQKTEALIRTTLRELYGHADVDRTAKEWSTVASRCAQVALDAARSITEARFGIPLDSQQNRVAFSILAMGKMAGEELNLGSDIDLCYFYETDDGQAGGHSLHEHFSRVAKLVTTLLDEITDEGFVFRVDLRLRPEGSRGAIANSLLSAERYYETWGRPWERAALLRSRPCAGDGPFGVSLQQMLRQFVFRRGIDPTIAIEVSKMLDQSRQEQLKDNDNDLKLGRGGIREAEFFIQSLQLIWGGRHTALQTPSTVSAAQRLRSLALLSHRETEEFLDAWAVLRRAEHRVQMMAGYATHLVFVEPTKRLALARSLGYASVDAFEYALFVARNTVKKLFSTLFTEGESAVQKPPSQPPPASPEAELCALVSTARDDADAVAEISERAKAVLGVADGEASAYALLRLARKADSPFGIVGRHKSPELAAQLLSEIRDAPDPELSLTRFASLLERVGTALPRYAARLASARETTRALLGLLGTSEALTQVLIARPELIDAVCSVGMDAPASDEIARNVEQHILAIEGDFSDEWLDDAVGSLRKAMREVELSVGLADIGRTLTAGEVSRRLSALAQGVVRACFLLAGLEAKQRYGLSPESREPLDGIAVFALGSLAARELAYGGDVDVIVLHDEHRGETRGARRRGITFAEYASRVTQRAIAFLSTPHAQGNGYSVDTRLRPSGAQGTLVVSLRAFESYHSARVDRPAGASWERQALIRARGIAGDKDVLHAAQTLIDTIAYEQGPPDADELRRLRLRMENELGAEKPGFYSLKHGPGALVDIEFAAQALQMKHGADRSVRTPTTRDALRALQAAGYLAEQTATTLLQGEKILRRALLATRLVHQRSWLVEGASSTAAVARKLGFRTRSDQTASSAVLFEIAQTRARVREAFERVLSTIAAR